MPSTAIALAAVLIAVLVVAFLILRSRNKIEEAPRFEPPREIAKRPPKDVKGAGVSGAPPQTEDSDAEPTVSGTSDTLELSFPLPPPPKPAEEEEEEATQIAAPPSAEVEVD